MRTARNACTSGVITYSSESAKMNPPPIPFRIMCNRLPLYVLPFTLYSMLADGYAHASADTLPKFHLQIYKHTLSYYDIRTIYTARMRSASICIPTACANSFINNHPVRLLSTRPPPLFLAPYLTAFHHKPAPSPAFQTHTVNHPRTPS